MVRPFSGGRIDGAWLGGVVLAGLVGCGGQAVIDGVGGEGGGGSGTETTTGTGTGTGTGVETSTSTGTSTGTSTTTGTGTGTGTTTGTGTGISECSDEPNFDLCVDCCVNENPAGLEAINSFYVIECVCGGGITSPAPCEQNCQGFCQNGNINMSCQTCLDELNNGSPIGDECLNNTYSQCFDDFVCTELLDCVSTCPG